MLDFRCRMDEITAPYALAELAAPVELRVRPRVTVAWKTDMGRVRENNEDKCEYYLQEDDAALASKGHIFVVCDGMGGHEAGQIASELTCKTFLQTYLHHPATEVPAALVGSVNAANRFVFDVAASVPSRRGMGTTLTAMALVQDHIFVANVGDSRLYRLRDEEVDQLTVDQTWVEQVVAEGVMSRAQAEAHPYRHVLTQAVGTNPDVKTDLGEFQAAVGDVYLLCSDGLTNHVSDEEIRAVLSSLSPSAAAWELVSRALQDGGSDNCTVIVVRIDGLDTA